MTDMKKKNVKKHQNDPKMSAKMSVGSSEDDQEMATLRCKSCSHVKSSVNFTQLRKSLKNKNTDLTVCQPCEKISRQDADSNYEEMRLDFAVWLCLQCGHRGCDRNSRSQHSLAHYQTPRSTSHAIVMNTTDWRIWCYDCDDEISSSCCKNLENCVEFLKRRQLNATVVSNRSNEVSTGEEIKVENSTDAGLSQVGKEVEAVSKEMEKNGGKPTKKSIALPKVKGLRNLGNTCFFNAVVQALSQTQLLFDLLPKCLDERTVKLVPDNKSKSLNLPPLDVQITPHGNNSLTSSLATILQDARCNDSRAVLSPTALYNATCNVAPQFRGFQQHDSHELLRHLLDGVRAEEIREMQRGILKAFNLSTKTDPAGVVKEVKEKLNGYGKLARHTIIDSIFSGQLVSTVMCEECQTPSQVFETFLDLSLPVTEDKPTRPGSQRKQVEGFGNTTAHQSGLAAEEGFTNQDKRARKKAARLARVQNCRSQQTETVQVARKNGKSKGPVIDGIMELFDSPMVVETLENHVRSAENSTDKNQSDFSDADVEDNLESGSNNSTTNAMEISASTDIAQVNGEDGQQIEKVESAPCNASEETLHANLQDLTLNGIEDIDDKEKICNGEVDAVQADAATEVKVCRKHEWIESSRRTLANRQQLAEHCCSILSCLAQFTSRELLTGNNKFGCDNCTRLKRKSQKGNKPEVVYSNASKQLLVLSPPAVLTLHLKRFQQTLTGLRKVDRHVEFPQVLDLAPFCSSACLGLASFPQKQTQILYSLFGVVEHSGRLTGGHYTAFVKVRPARNGSLGLLNRNPVSVLDTEDMMVTMRSKCSDVFLEKEDIAQLAAGPCKWFHVSDTHVAEVSENTVLKSQAYILFYERIF